MSEPDPVLDQRARRRRAILYFAIAVGTLIRLYFAFTTYGTNDVRYWETFRDYILKNDSVTIYRDISYYNHPPFMSLVLVVFSKIAPYAPNGFPFVMRLPAILSDVGSALLIFKVVSRLWSADRALWCGVTIALSPVLILVSGFHGNTDPVFMFLILLACDRVIFRGSAVQAGLALGLAVNIKLVPLLLCPAFFFWIPNHKDRARFFATFTAMFVAGYAYHLIVALPTFKKNVFDYGSVSGTWGISQIFKTNGKGDWLPALSEWAKRAILLCVTAAGFANAWRMRAADPQARGRALLGVVAVVFLIFFILSPGFGIQYMAWFVAPSLFLSVRGGVLYNLLAGFFVYRVYLLYCGGKFPCWIADSHVTGNWKGADSVLALAVWCFFLVWAAILASRALPRA